VGSEPFAVLLPDMLMRATNGAGCLPGLMQVYGRTDGNVIAVEECDPQKTDQYGIVAPGEAIGNAFRIAGMVEKPKPAAAPSNLYINGRYVFQPEIFDHLSRIERGAGGEIQLTDAMLGLSREQPFWGWRFTGETFDCGSKLGFLAANVAIALERPDTAAAVRAELDRLLRR
jgi:UTP--glucose-1-phosphate uridylyltransferase